MTDDLEKLHMLRIELEPDPVREMMKRDYMRQDYIGPGWNSTSQYEPKRPLPPGALNGFRQPSAAKQPRHQKPRRK